MNPLNFYIFKHFTWTNHQISVITCKLCKLVILHFQAGHDIFLAYLYIHRIQCNLPSGLLLRFRSFSSEILVMVLGRWWKLHCLFKQFHLNLSYSLYNLVYLIGQICLRKQEHDIWDNEKANVNTKVQNSGVFSMAKKEWVWVRNWSGDSVSNKGKDKVPTKIREECKENYARFGVLKLF